ncbi:hypothetical protein NC653_023147 [Populus alba x Populus x berolinensis]|uniref:Uncharacterized protein n=1 Tax=Populus alba x Populus x berolinensis TaxID=444605 RepID=A0AAD6QAL5_9ROSI|nr:hypothetical protein NC653_023147 [Populus alba x Populus x berolinensis]
MTKEKAVKVSFNGATVGYFHDRQFLSPSNKPHPVPTKVSILFFIFYLMFVVCEIDTNLAAFFLMVTSRYFLNRFLDPGRSFHSKIQTFMRLFFFLPCSIFSHLVFYH